MKLNALKLNACALFAGMLIGCDKSLSPYSSQASRGTASAIAARTNRVKAALLAHEQARESRLFTCNSVLDEGTTIRVAGSAKVPNGTDVGVVLETAGTGDLEGTSQVKNGKWDVSLDAPVAPGFYEVAHHLTATPMLGDRELGIDRDVRIEKNPRASSYPSATELPQPDSFPSGSPERTLAQVVQDWKRHDWSDMARWVHMMHMNSVAQKTSQTDPKFDMSNEDNMFDESPVQSRIEECKAQFHSWEVQSARFGKIDVGADPQAPISNAMVTLHLRTILDGREEDVDVLWVLEWCRSDQSLHPRDRWGVAIGSVRPQRP